MATEMPTDGSGSVSRIPVAVRWLRYLVPRSLQRQAALALLGLALLIVAGGGTALYSVRELTLVSRQLAEERIMRVQVTQDLVGETSAISLEAYQLITTASASDAHRIYAQMLLHLETLDRLVTQLGTASEDMVVLDLHHASQLFRNSANVATQLHEDILRSEAEFAKALQHRIGQLEDRSGREPLPLIALLQQLGNARRVDEVQALRAKLPRDTRPATPSLTVAAGNPESQVQNLFSLRLRLLGKQEVMTSLRDELHRQSQAMASIAHTLSTASTQDYREAVQRLAIASENNQRWLLMLFISSLLVTYAIARMFLGRHVIGRLDEVSHYLRGNVSDKEPCIVPVQGRDEIAEMARALEKFLEDRRQLARTRASLEIEQQRLAAIIDNTADSIIVLHDGCIQQLNSAGERMFGWRSVELVGQPVENLLSQFDPPLEIAHAAARSATGRNRSGQGFPVEVSVSEVASQDGSMSILVARDVTLRRAVEQQLIAARDAAVAARAAQTVFLTKMSHELRTPLNAILGYAQILQKDKTWTEPQAAGLRTIESSGEHLLMLINDILEIAKIEAGKVDLNPGPIHLPTFLQVVSDIIMVKARQKNVGFVFETLGDLPQTVKVEEKRLRQVLLNLLGNAVKFTDQGQVCLAVRMLDVDGTQARIRFEVRDTGIGIDESQLQRLFEPFEQVCDATRRQTGTGLGLSISRQLIRLMGSDIQVESAPGQGSVFWFDLCLPVLAAEVETVPAEGKVIGYEGATRSILIVDDTTENRKMLAYLLSSLGFQVDEAENGPAALEHVQASKPDLILMDMLMPMMDGLEATRRIRQNETLAHIPIMIISATVSDEDQPKWRAAGGDAFVAKPIKRETLLRQIGLLLGLAWTYQQPGTTFGEPPVWEAPLSFEVVPTRQELQELHYYTRVGNMSSISAEALRILALDERYRPFTDKVQYLAKTYQSKALVALVEECMGDHPE